jgi:hypothetical protein
MRRTNFHTVSKYRNIPLEVLPSDSNISIRSKGGILGNSYSLMGGLHKSGDTILTMVKKAWPANREFNMEIGLGYMETQISLA